MHGHAHQVKATLPSGLDHSCDGEYSRASVDDDEQEPDAELRAAVVTHGAGAVLAALGRVLLRRRRELRREGEIDAAKAARKASEACTEHGSKLSDAGV